VGSNDPHKLNEAFIRSDMQELNRAYSENPYTLDNLN
jgi:hypothetical protein